MGFSKLPQNCSKSIFIFFSFTYSQIWLILVTDDCQCGLHKKKLAKKKKKLPRMSWANNRLLQSLIKILLSR